MEKVPNEKYNRRKFLKRTGWLLMIPLGIAWFGTFKRQSDKLSHRIIRLPDDLPGGITFYEELIINNSVDEVQVFSAKCPHLGCMISKIEGNHLVCPCHGSRFLFNGQNIKGPAAGNLISYIPARDPRNGSFVVEI
jgi:nitrite reductase/ring-hydroxylating ferredoxin subunit